jgi:succinylglutamate desuccinylase
MGSLHGNEPAGFLALTRAFHTVTKRRPPLRGEVVALTGNRAALLAGQRFVDRDLNRIWLPETIDALKTARIGPSDAVELAEIVEILTALDDITAGARGPVYVLDLHTTSGDSPPFATISDTLYNRAFALRFGVPIILGLEEHLDGTFLAYVDRLGHGTIGFEGGRHDDPAAVDHLEACAWVALAASGVLAIPDAVPEVAAAERLLRGVSRGVPRVLEVRYRHSVTPEDAFDMDSGFASFQPVVQGQLVGRDRAGDVVSPQRGRLLMPLYQTQGDDGFFVMREFRRFWLAVSAILRHLNAHTLLHWLPGVRRDPDDPDTLIIDRKVARWYALQLFHLVGYRKVRLVGKTLVVSRRREPV